jgi:PAS domain S-box-containing protein
MMSEAAQGGAARERARARSRTSAKPDADRAGGRRLEALDLLRIQRNLGVSLSTISEIRPALRRVLAAALSVEGIDAGGVYLVNRSAQTVELVAHRGLSREFIRVVKRYDVTAPLARRVMGGRPVYRDVHQVQQQPLFVREGFLAVAGFPIRYSRDVIAVMNLASRTCGAIPRFTRTVLGAIAAQIGTVIPRIRAETEWREAQRNLQSLFNTMSDLLFVLDRKGRILEINQAVIDLLGHSRKSLLGRPIAEIQPGTLLHETSNRIGDLSPGAESERRIPLLTRSGREIAVETRLTEGRWYGKRVLFGISRDVSVQRHLEAEVVRISEAEKNRMAENIHDNQMPQLVGIGMLADCLREQIAAGNTPALTTANRIHTIARDLLATNRRLIQGLAPLAPLEGGICMALQRLVLDAKDTFGCDCRLYCRIGTGTLDPQISAQLYYIAQESIRNACTHGAATRIVIHLNVLSDAGLLVVKDNGSGLKQGAASLSGMGIRIMACRAGIIGGRLSVRAEPRRGVSVRCAFSPAHGRAFAPRAATRRTKRPGNPPRQGGRI